MTLRRHKNHVRDRGLNPNLVSFTFDYNKLLAKCISQQVGTKVVDESPGFVTFTARMTNFVERSWEREYNEELKRQLRF